MSSHVPCKVCFFRNRFTAAFLYAGIHIMHQHLFPPNPINMPSIHLEVIYRDRQAIPDKSLATMTMFALSTNKMNLTVYMVLTWSDTTHQRIVITNIPNSHKPMLILYIEGMIRRGINMTNMPETIFKGIGTNISHVAHKLTDNRRIFLLWPINTLSINLCWLNGFNSSHYINNAKFRDRECNLASYDVHMSFMKPHYRAQ